jgi:predicted unusual protein kinase regulating ubiquinone biosynthesis (AarF/ABC1/UbiB family)
MILAPRYLPRLAATIGLFTRYGLRDFAKQQGLEGIAPEPGEDGGDDPSVDKAAAFRKKLVELGPAYVKLGQVLSTRPDLLPNTYIRELEKLQDDVDPIPYSEVERIVEEELKTRISKLFESFETEPLGSASLGQVHAAALREGRSVVVKVQRPNIRADLADDVEFFHAMASFLTAHTKAGERIDMIGVIQQLERALADELDYRIEARNAATFRRSLSEFPRILIPKVIEAYSTERVLTTERIRGTKIDEVSPLVRIEHDFHPVADELTRAYLKQITIDGHFHADPHPGNIFVVMPDADNPWTPSEVKAMNRRTIPRTAVTPLAKIERQAQEHAAPQPDDVDVKLAMIDFGMTARLSTTLREHVVALLMDIADNRGDDAANVLVEMGDQLPGFDRPTYVSEVAALMARSYDLAIGEMQAGKVLYDLINTSYQHSLRLPAELTLLAKAMFNLDAVTRAIDPNFSPIPTIRQYGNEMAQERAKRDLNPRRLFQLATQGSDLVMALPHRLDLISARMAANEFELRMQVPQLVEVMQGMQKVANRVFSGLVLAGLLVASAMLMQYRRSLATIGFVIAGAIGIWMVLTILWTDRRSGDRS